jgi:hypothetical protein
VRGGQRKSARPVTLGTFGRDINIASSKFDLTAPSDWGASHA